MTPCFTRKMRQVSGVSPDGNVTPRIVFTETRQKQGILLPAFPCLLESTRIFKISFRAPTELLSYLDVCTCLTHSTNRQCESLSTPKEPPLLCWRANQANVCEVPRSLQTQSDLQRFLVVLGYFSFLCGFSLVYNLFRWAFRFLRGALALLC